ncbi:MAG: 3-deoxy-manno-octulosonate cytidylyltransferase [Candidatus Thioglobus sp.]|jgi:3-deoxy-manno-octulosonate cytidylyltransferase (CMP-KDO synthetase)
MKSVVIIPARYKSSRFPGKPLVNLLGKPMILWVSELSAQAVGKENVYIATDDERISKAVTTAGFNAIMTSNQCLTGTDRLAEAANKIPADIYINVQGDEPLVNPKDILNIIKAKKTHYNEIINGFCPIARDEDPNNVNIPKVIFTENNSLVYMSRQAIPGFKDNSQAPSQYYKQVCIYAFTADELKSYADYGRKSALEASEDIEIIRFLEWGKKIRMVETNPGSLAVDVREDVAKVEQGLRELHNV